MHNGAQKNHGQVSWTQSLGLNRANSERWNRPRLQNGSHTFWQAVQARRAPRSELEWEHSAREALEILDALT